MWSDFLSFDCTTPADRLIKSSIKTIAALYVGKLVYDTWRFQYLLNKKGNNKKTVVVTGGASGLGYETCKLFAQNEWNVIAIDINSKGLEELQATSTSIQGYVVDISSVKSIDDFFDELSKNSKIKVGGIDALVNCAGLALPGPCLGVSWDRMELQFRVNIIGVIYLTKKLIPLLVQNNSGGNIVNISSVAGTTAWPWQGAYSASKFALEGFTDVIRREAFASGLNLRVTAIQPGGIITPLSKAIPQQLQQWVQNNSSHPFASGATASLNSMQQVLKNESLLNLLMMVTPQHVAKFIYVASVDPLPHYRYVVTTPLMQILTTLLRYLPMWLGDRLALQLYCEDCNHPYLRGDICIGNFILPRNDLENLIKEYGGSLIDENASKNYTHLLQGDQADLHEIQRAEENGCDVVTEQWLNKAIEGNEVSREKIHVKTPGYRRKYPEDSFLEDLLAMERLCGDYQVGMKCYRPDEPDRVYVIKKFETLTQENVVATLELLDNPLGLPSETQQLFHDSSPNPAFKFLPSEAQIKFYDKYCNQEPKEGVWRSHATASLMTKVNQYLNQFAASEIFDYKPDTNNIVRLLIDPSLYAIKLDTSIWSLSSWWEWLGKRQHPQNQWNEMVQKSQFQWLPAEISINSSGQVQLDSDINNLNRARYPELYQCFEHLVEQMIPGFAAVWKYCSCIQFHSLFTDLTSVLPVSWVDTRLQLIVKATDYNLPPGAEYEDLNWIYEGGYPEQIVMTGIYFASRSSPLEGGCLEFRRQLEIYEGRFVVEGPVDTFGEDPEMSPFGRSEWFTNIVNNWIKPLGKISSPETGDLVVFPNCHSYRFSKLKNPLPDQPLHQRILQFQLIHPHRPIVSTASSSSLVSQRFEISLEEALQNRNEIRRERQMN